MPHTNDRRAEDKAGLPILTDQSGIDSYSILRMILY